MTVELQCEGILAREIILLKKQIECEEVKEEEGERKKENEREKGLSSVQLRGEKTSKQNSN